MLCFENLVSEYYCSHGSVESEVSIRSFCRLHLIDFEQLKIENQTVNEKIEERNEEILKLRKKNTTTVQVKQRRTSSYISADRACFCQASYHR